MQNFLVLVFPISMIINSYCELFWATGQLHFNTFYLRNNYNMECAIVLLCVIIWLSLNNNNNNNNNNHDNVYGAVIMT